MTNKDKSRQIKTNPDKYRQILTNADKCGQIQTNADKYKQIRTNSDKSRHIRTNKNKSGQIKTNPDKYRQIRTNKGKSKANTGKYFLIDVFNDLLVHDAEVHSIAGWLLADCMFRYCVACSFTDDIAFMAPGAMHVLATWLQAGTNITPLVAALENHAQLRTSFASFFSNLDGRRARHGKSVDVPVIAQKARLVDHLLEHCHFGRSAWKQLQQALLA